MKIKYKTFRTSLDDEIKVCLLLSLHINITFMYCLFYYGTIDEDVM